MIRISLLIITLLFSGVVFAEYKTQDAILSYFKKYSAADAKMGNEHLADMVVKVQQAVDFAMKNKSTSNDLLREIGRVSSITLKNDPSAAVGEVLVPLYKRDPAAFEKSLKSLPKTDAREVIRAVKDAVKEQDSGNG